MRSRPLIWFFIALACLLGALYCWRLGDQRNAEKKAATTAKPEAAAEEPAATTPKVQITVLPASTSPMAHFAIAQSNNPPANAEVDPRLKYRLNNTTKTLGQLQESDQAILLANALIDISQPLNLAIPDSLRADDNPGSYIVQSRGVIGDSFRARLNGVGATVVSYIPNNAYLVRATAATAQQLAGFPETQAVIPFQPYYKLDWRLLTVVLEDIPLPRDSILNVVPFNDGKDKTIEELGKIGGKVLGEDRSPFGPILKVQLPTVSLPALAKLPDVQTISLASARAQANDLSRLRTSVAIDTQVSSNYMNLTGSNVWVTVNDSGIDVGHPDLTPARVFSPFPGSLVDTIGHGTHVGGIIVGSGGLSSSVGNASGSIMPAVSGQFRGGAPNAKLLSLPILSSITDFELQEFAARTNALISNNSWTYAGSDYDISAASFDAAVRDSLPEVMGPQGVIYVFAAGNQGNASDNGTGGSAGTIQTPATAKNVITVGALEQPRDITNEVTEVTFQDGEFVTNTITPWKDMTSSDSEVAPFSSRGNVGINIEGEFGRFKPDVVAPGTFVVSTRSRQWDQASYYDTTTYIQETFNDLVKTNALHHYPKFLEFNVVEFLVAADAIFPDVDLPVYIKFGIPLLTDVPSGTNLAIRTFPNPVNQQWRYGVSNPTNRTVRYQITTRKALTNEQGNFFQVLSNINSEVGPNYRYESGTSMSAADITGMLALMQDYFSNKLSTLPSPALMKALLINGARNPNAKYDFRTRKTVNAAGWGLPNLTNSIPQGLASQASSGATLFFDQNSTNSLTTGERYTANVSINAAAGTDPLRVTVVWTDPPGNPAASIKLVNDLDLVVTNLASGEVYYGNDIEAGSVFTVPANTNTAPRRDSVNNVENVFVQGPVGSNSYSISVIGRRINVNAVTGQSNKVSQDFALVISSGDGFLTNALTLTVPGTVVQVPTTALTAITNAFTGAATNEVFGQILLNQLVGVNPALIPTNTVPVGSNTVWDPYGTNGFITIGFSNQWHFYVITNNTSDSNGVAFKNAGFATFLVPNLSPPRMGVTNYANEVESARVEADIDLYVLKGTTGPNLLNLDPVAVDTAGKSLGRLGTEFVVDTNSQKNDVYYIGVKSEDHQAAEYAFFGGFSRQPFSQTDSNGVLVRGINVPAEIPDGSPQKPGGAMVLGLCVQPVDIRRVTVTNEISHANIGDLFGELHHGQISAVLNNHSCVENPATGNCFTNHTYIYEDNGENDIAGSQPTDSPGSLTEFIGEHGEGVWLLTEVDSAFDSKTGRVDEVWIRLEPLQGADGSNINLTIQPNSFAYASVDVPIEATNMTIQVINTTSGGQLPLEFYIRRGELPTQTLYDHTMHVLPNTTNNTLTISRTNLPPLQSGRYYLGVFNPNPIVQKVQIRITLDLDLAGVTPFEYKSTQPVPIIDDAVSYSTILVTNNQKIAQVWVDLQAHHERISDVAFQLLSPSGKRIMLVENRGGNSSEGLGGSASTSDTFTADEGGNAEQTKILPSGTNGVLTVNYDFEVVPDSMHVYYDSTLIYDTGLVSGRSQFSVPFAGVGTSITIVMNEGSISDTNTHWSYSATIFSTDEGYLTLTDDTNFSRIPIKFAPPPFVGSNSATLATNLPFQGLFYFPEETFKPLIGEFAQGLWKLEMWDSRAGATNLPALLSSWRLRFVFDNVAPNITPLVHGVPVTNTIPACGTNYYYVDVPPWATFATNTLLFATAPVNVWFNTNSVPTGTNPGDDLLLPAATNGAVTIDTTGTPPRVLYPSTRYYLAVENPCANSNAVTYAIQVEFNITPLTNGIPVVSTNGPNVIPRYFYYDVSSNATAVSFQLTNLTGNVDLVARKGAPLPTLLNFDYGSFSPGVFEEDIFVFTNSVPVPLGPGRWYLGVFNRDGTPSTYDIVAIEYTNVFPRIITLTNGIPYPNVNNVIGGASDYYRYVVTPNAARVQFEIFNASGDMTLVAHKGLPLPSLALYDYISANAFTNDEVIVVLTNSVPIPLTPGSWFLTAVNVFGGPVSYNIKATEWGISGQPIPIIGISYNPPNGTNAGSFCITWQSLPGVHYYVEGVPNMGDPWQVASPTIIATGPTTTYCVILPSPYHFFRVVEGSVQYVPLMLRISRDPAGYLLSWSGNSTNQYQVQWVPSLPRFTPPGWNIFTNTITSTNTSFSFLDDGTQVPLGPRRFYRVQQLP